MSKKRVQKQKKSSAKKSHKEVKRRMFSKKSQQEKSNLQTEVRNFETRKKSDVPNKHEEFKLSSDNSILNYYSKALHNDFDTYSPGLLKILLNNEKNKENLAEIKEEILIKYGLNKELRKYAFKYLLAVLKPYNPTIKICLKTLSVFDLFLINYAKEQHSIPCSHFFHSKHGKNFSQTKLILLILCCFFLVNQTFNTHNFDLRCLDNWDNKGEMNYDEVNELVYNIMKTIECNIDVLGISDFIEIFLFDLNKRLKDTKENIFINYLNQTINFFSLKIVQNISLNDIRPSVLSLGIIMFSLEYSKFLSKNNFHNINNVNGLIENWLNEVKNYLNEYPREDLKRVIQWLNAYVNNN